MAVLIPKPNNGSQLERAVAAWLIDATSGNAIGSQIFPTQIFFTNDSRQRPDPKAFGGLVDIFAERSEHDPEFSGTEIWDLHVRAKYPAANQPGDANPQINRLMIDQLIGLIDAALLQSSGSENMDFTADGITTSGRALATSGTPQDQANNFDMANFTCMFVRFAGSTRGFAKDDDGYQDTTNWIEARRYRMTCAATAIN